jgi:hypothetical protein
MFKNNIVLQKLLSKKEIIFISMAEVGRHLGTRPSYISSVCSGKLKQTGGWNFKKVVNRGQE